MRGFINPPILYTFDPLTCKQQVLYPLGRFKDGSSVGIGSPKWWVLSLLLLFWACTVAGESYFEDPLPIRDLVAD